MDSEEHEFIVEAEDPGPVHDVADSFIQLHEELNVVFPRSFVDFHLSGNTHVRDVKCHGGRTENCDFHDLLAPRFEYYGTDIRAAKQAILEGLSESRSYFAKVFPFGQDGAGGQFCFDYVRGEEPLITKLDSDYCLLARSFDEFIARSNGVDVPPIAEQEIEDFTAPLPESW